MYTIIKQISYLNFERKYNKQNRDVHALIQEYRLHLWITTCKTRNDKKGLNCGQEIKKQFKYNNTSRKITNSTVNNFTIHYEEEMAQAFKTQFEKIKRENPDNNFKQNFKNDIDHNITKTLKHTKTFEIPIITEEEYTEKKFL